MNIGCASTWYTCTMGISTKIECHTFGPCTCMRQHGAHAPRTLHMLHVKYMVRSTLHRLRMRHAVHQQHVRNVLALCTGCLLERMYLERVSEGHQHHVCAPN